MVPVYTILFICKQTVYLLESLWIYNNGRSQKDCLGKLTVNIKNCMFRDYWHMFYKLNIDNNSQNPLNEYKFAKQST